MLPEPVTAVTGFGHTLRSQEDSMDENEVPQVVTMEDAPEVVEDELVEDVSIDGMCGVY